MPQQAVVVQVDVNNISIAVEEITTALTSKNIIHKISVSNEPLPQMAIEPHLSE